MSWKAWSKLAKDETYWQNHQERGLLKAEPIGSYVLRLWFEEALDVAIYELDFAPLLFEEDPGTAFLPLREAERFQFVKGDYALIWPNPETGAYDEKSIDLAPECVRFFCERSGKLIKGPVEPVAA
ncbi:MAG: hypothetical protein AAF921_14685 [Cyanobacteria bacterium P01_D01_bin.44]